MTSSRWCCSSLTFQMILTASSNDEYIVWFNGHLCYYVDENAEASSLQANYKSKKIQQATWCFAETRRVKGQPIWLDYEEDQRKAVC